MKKKRFAIMWDQPQILSSIFSKVKFKNYFFLSLHFCLFANGFLVACTQLYKPLCWLVGPSVCLLVSWSVCPLLKTWSTQLLAIGLVGVESQLNPFFHYWHIVKEQSTITWLACADSMPSQID